MPNRLDIELTSVRGDGSYTWRAAGARQPKGVIDGKILADGAKVGDVLRVEAEVEIDGITILAVLPPKEKAEPPGRIELLGSSKPVAAVTTVLISEGGHGRGDRRDLLDSPRRNERSGGRDRRPARGGERPDARRPQTAGGASDAGERRPERRPRPEGATAGRAPRPGGEGRPERRPRSEGAVRNSASPDTPAQRRPRPSSTTERVRAPGGERNRPAAAARPSTRRVAPRFEPGTAHRDLLLANLAPEQKPIAERLAAGGIPAVRRAIAEERERARTEHRPEVSGEAILALAEQLAPSIKQAIWLDRAEAAVAQIEQISLRDLRTTVAAAAPRDEAARDLDRKLREELERRIKKLRSHWEEQIIHALDEGRVLQALRFSAQPPEPTARFPATLIERLAQSAGAAMTTSTPTERWLALLEAAVASPIRRQIHPEGLAEDSSGEVVRKARLAAGSIPALAPMLGLSMPPPPTPIRSSRPSRPARPPARPPRRHGAPGAAPSGARVDARHQAPSSEDGQGADASNIAEEPEITAEADSPEPVEQVRLEDGPQAKPAEEPEITAEADSPQVRLEDGPQAKPAEEPEITAESEPPEPVEQVRLEDGPKANPAESSQDLSVAQSPAEVTESVVEVAHAEALEQDAVAEEALEAVPANDTAVTEVAEDGSATSLDDLSPEPVAPEDASGAELPVADGERPLTTESSGI